MVEEELDWEMLGSCGLPASAFLGPGSLPPEECMTNYVCVLVKLGGYDDWMVHHTLCTTQSIAYSTTIRTRCKPSSDFYFLHSLLLGDSTRQAILSLGVHQAESQALQVGATSTSVAPDQQAPF